MWFLLAFSPKVDPHMIPHPFSWAFQMVAGHFNPGLFNPSLNPGFFNPRSLCHQLFNPRLWGWKFHAWKFRGWNVIQMSEVEEFIDEKSVFKISRFEVWGWMPCHSMGPKWFWTVQIILVWSSTNHFGRAQFVLVGFKSFWTGPNFKNYSRKV